MLDQRNYQLSIILEKNYLIEDNIFLNFYFTSFMLNMCALP